MNRIGLTPMNSPRFGFLPKNLKAEYTTASINQIFHSQAYKTAGSSASQEPDAQVSELLSVLNLLLTQSRALDELDHPRFFQYKEEDRYKHIFPKDEKEFTKYDEHGNLRNLKKERRQAVVDDIYSLKAEFSKGLGALTPEQKLLLAQQALKICGQLAGDLFYTPGENSEIAQALHEAIQPLMEKPQFRLPDDFLRSLGGGQLGKGNLLDLPPDKFDPNKREK